MSRSAQARPAFLRLIGLLQSIAGYGIVSVLALALELLLLHALLQSRLPPPAAVTCAYLSASLFQFCALRYIVFKATQHAALVQANRYVAAALVSWLLVLGLVSALSAITGISTMLAREISIPMLFPVNYLLSRYFIFRRR